MKKIILTSSLLLICSAVALAQSQTTELKITREQTNVHPRMIVSHDLKESRNARFGEPLTEPWLFKCNLVAEKTKICTKPNEFMRIGNAILTKYEYIFINDKLETVRTEGIVGLLDVVSGIFTFRYQAWPDYKDEFKTVWNKDCKQATVETTIEQHWKKSTKAPADGVDETITVKNCPKAS